MVLNHGELRALILECLRKDRPQTSGDSPLQMGDLMSELAERAKKHDAKICTGEPAWFDNRNRSVGLHQNLNTAVWNIVWDLIIEGVVRPGNGWNSSFELPFLHVTEFGKQSLKGIIAPHDYDGYLRNLSTKVPNLDPIIMKYVAESVATFRHHCFLSSTITLGCASEKAFLLLLDSYTDALGPAEQAAFSTIIAKERSVKILHSHFKKEYDAKLKARLKTSGKDGDWLSEMENALTFVFSYFRDVRNDAGHPTGTAFSREMVQSHLVVLPAYLRTMYDLIEWIKAHKPL